MRQFSPAPVDTLFSESHAAECAMQEGEKCSENGGDRTNIITQRATLLTTLRHCICWWAPVCRERSLQ